MVLQRTRKHAGAGQGLYNRIINTSTVAVSAVNWLVDNQLCKFLAMTAEFYLRCGLTLLSSGYE